MGSFVIADGRDAAAEAHLEDVATLAASPVLSGLAIEEIGALLARFEPAALPAGSRLFAAGEPADALGFVLEGEVAVERAAAPTLTLGPSSVVGALGFASGSRHRETVVTLRATRVAWLRRAALDALARDRAEVAFHLAQALARQLALTLDDSAPPALTRGPADMVRAHELLVPSTDGGLVVAARLEERAVGLDEWVARGSVPAPITTRTGEGREVLRRSAGLMLLEAARRIGAPPLRLGPSITSGRIVFVEGGTHAEALVAPLQESLARVASEDVELATEMWSTARAIDHFAAVGWHEAAELLRSSSHSTVELLRCGSVRALGPGPLLPRSSLLQGLAVLPHPQGLLLDFGPHIRRELEPRPYSTVAMEMRSPRYGAQMTRHQEEWLGPLGVTSVGSFNTACVTGQVKELIFVSEGFHEKHIAQIADGIASRAGLKIVAVAGPSASGKTTFIKRLSVQLEVNGIHPVGLSLDDYYLDRARAPHDTSGKPDFELLRALDLALLDEHVGRLLAGETVTTPRYDFRVGKSIPAGGATLRLAKNQVLLIEGIHALNPALLEGGDPASVFRVFVHPAMSLPFDRLTRLESFDVRLLRRIVRDRHQRGFAADDNLGRWPSVRRGERLSIFPYQEHAHCVFDSSLVYEPSVLKVYADRYLLEVPRRHAEFPAAQRLRRLLESFVPIHPDNVPPTSILREFIGGSGFSY
jgi:uridine kinase